MQGHYETGMAVAKYLERHPKVKRDFYTGLPSHPQYELARKQQKGECGLLSIELDGDVSSVATFVNHLKLFAKGDSWGGFESLAIAYTYQWSEEELEFHILICVGLMIGAWIVSGTIPFLVYIGLQIISPKYIIVTSFLVTVILSVSTGTSWGAAGTVGAALMSVAAGMGAPLPAVAGAIVSGAYFGDKMSPLSDSTNMSAIATNTNLYKHIGHMLYTTVPGFIVSCIVYVIAGWSFATNDEVGRWKRLSKA